MKNPFLAMLVLAAMSGCQNVPVWKYDMFERPEGNFEYSETFLSGWRDGCESGAQASANHFYRMKYQFKQDWQLIVSDESYKRGWDTAYNQCRKYILQHNVDIERFFKPANIEEEENLWTWQK